jgi:hypothetical protein
MRIIGSANRDEYICVLTNDEIANLMGVSSHYSVKGGEPAVGSIIPVSRIYLDARDTLDAYADIKKELSNLQNRAAKLLSLMRPEKKED